MWIFSFMFGPIPFYDASDESLVSQMIRVVGYLPSDEWQEKWERMRLNFDRKLSTLEDGELPELEERFNETHDERLLPLMSIVQGLMRYQPSNRITTSKALNVLRRMSFPKRKQKSFSKRRC